MGSEQYTGDNALKYSRSQRKFYATHPDDSRKILYSLLDMPLEKRVILDAGCGSGEDIAFFDRNGAEIYGVDSSQDMIKLARRKNPNLGRGRLYTGDFAEMPFENSFFDIIFSRYTIQYADEIDPIYREFKRTLKSKGDLIILVAHPVLGFVAKKVKDYHKREVVKIPIYDGNVEVRWPSHTFEEYLSPYLLRHFVLEKLIEQSPENKTNENTFPEIVPDYMVMKLRKR